MKTKQIAFVWSLMTALTSSALTVDPAEYGFSPNAAPEVNAAALQKALDGGKRTVECKTSGVYGVDRTIFIDSDTTLTFAPGTVLKKMANYANMVVNRAAYEGGCDSNIVVRHLELSINKTASVVPGPDSACPGLRGQFAFYRVKNVACYDFTCNDNETGQYCWQAVDFDGLTLDGFTIRGDKDGVHINAGRNFILRHGILRTGDDGIALNAGDWPGACTPKMGSIEDGLIEDIVDEPGGHCNFARVITGCWKEWHKGMRLQRDDIFKVGKRVYTVHPMPLGTNEYVSLTAPSHTHGTWTSPEGITYQYLQDDGATRADIRNVTFRNIQMNCARCISCSWEFGDYARLVHPEMDPKDYPVIDIRLEHVVKTVPGPIVVGNACANVLFDSVTSEKGALAYMGCAPASNVGNHIYPTKRVLTVQNCTFAGPERKDFGFEDSYGEATLIFKYNTFEREPVYSGSSKLTVVR